MNEADEALLRMALALTDEPSSGALTITTRQVMSRPQSHRGVRDDGFLSSINWRQGGRSPVYMQEGMMWFLTLLASMEGFALSDKMSGSEAIHAQVVRLQCGYFLVMWH